MKETDPLSTLSDIKQMMQKSSRFISLSGLSGVAAGVVGLAAAISVVYFIFPNQDIYQDFDMLTDWDSVKFIKLLTIAGGALALAISLAIFFTFKKSKALNTPIWDFSSKRLVINFLIPFITGGVFIIGISKADILVQLIVPCCLIFYGLSLVNASKYTLGEIRWLGIIEIILGLLNLFLFEQGLLFWTLGFGIAHIVYGVYMWNKYDRKQI